ncbi:MAG: phosphatase PAP2 family protein [Methylococcaceae bacterium]|nr:phosphatase PAP2 family protein [Methylococcaceae bacterium]
MKLLYSIHKCDVFMFTWLLNVRLHDSLTKVGRVVSKSGDGQLYVVIFALSAWQLGFENAFVQAMLLAFLIERPVYFVLKNGLKRNRPQAALENFRSSIIPSDQFSFPSGHTSAAFMMATLLGYSVPELLIPLYCWSALVGFSRIVLGVHFPTDTLMGALLGICTAMFSLAVVA